jgi:hypothetical protein
MIFGSKKNKKYMKSTLFLTWLMASLAVVVASCSGKDRGGSGDDEIPEVTITRAGGIPVSPFAFGNNYFNWVDWNHDGMVGLYGTEEPVKALHISLLTASNNQSDANAPQLFDTVEMDKFIRYCRAVGAEPLMIVPVYGNHVDGGPASAQGAADIVTYINGTRKYGVRYWAIGCEVDIYDQFFKRTTGLPVSNVSEYIDLYNAFARAMIMANEAAHSGIELKFVGPELGWRYLEGNDWLSPMLDECKDFIDIVSIHVYGFAARDLSVENILTDVDRFRKLVDDVKARIDRHARPGTPLSITMANICFEWDPAAYTPETRRLGPGTFYAALWYADRMGAALEAGLWTHAFWNLAEPVQGINGNVFGCILTDPSKDPPAYKLNPEYYAQWMINNNLSGTIIIPSGVPARLSVYTGYDSAKASTAVLVLNKDTLERPLKLVVDKLKPRSITFPPMSINLVTIPDDAGTEYSLLEYTIRMAEAGLPPAYRQ